jgi:hypothetical protein
LHARNHRHRQSLNREHHLGALSEKPLVIFHRRIGPHFLEVVTCAKSFAFGSNHNYTHGFVGGDRVELALKLRKHRFR